MNPRLTLGMVAVLAALAAAVYFLDTRGGSTSAAPTPTPRPDQENLQVFQFDDQAVNRVEVTSGDQTVTLEKDGESGWKLQPGGEPADQSRVSSIVLRLANLRATRRVPDAGDLNAFGLATPALTVVLGEQAATHTLQLGSKTPIETGVYAKKPEDASVFIISSALFNDLDRLVKEPPKAQLTPTPGPSPTAAPSPTPSPSPTPDSSPTPAPSPTAGS